jgi:uncharacterized RDD family membrane protein YckC
MKCPKCGYLGFDSGSRCRNCGYEFSLAADFELPDLMIRSDEGLSDFDDLALVGVTAAAHPAASAPAAPAEARPAVRQPRTASAAMPLFGQEVDDDTPLITRPSPPRAPLSVRRSTPEVARLRRPAAPKTSSLDLAFGTEAADGHSMPQVSSAPSPVYHEDAGLARRIAAVALDSIILLAIDLVVVYFTMQICGVGVSELGLLPKGPLVAFLIAQNVAYLFAFTAGGQTLGKMAAEIKIVSEDAGGAPDTGCALKRTTMWLLLAVPAGLGLLSAFADREHRGLHDRVAGTRVVRASA